MTIGEITDQDIQKKNEGNTEGGKEEPKLFSLRLLLGEVAEQDAESVKHRQG